MTKILASLFVLTLAFFTGLWVMIVGWGLEPDNWYVVIGGWFIATILHACANLIKD